MKNLDKLSVYGINHNELDLLKREEFVKIIVIKKCTMIP